MNSCVLLCLPDAGFIYIYLYIYIYLFIYFILFYFILFLYTFSFYSGLGPETYVALLINIHFFYIVCVLIVVSLLFSLIYMARIEDQSETNKLVKLSRCGLMD